MLAISVGGFSRTVCKNIGAIFCYWIVQYYVMFPGLSLVSLDKKLFIGKLYVFYAKAVRPQHDSLCMSAKHKVSQILDGRTLGPYFVIYN